MLGELRPRRQQDPVPADRRGGERGRPMRPRSAAASVRGVRHLWLPQELPVGRLGRLVAPRAKRTWHGFGLSRLRVSDREAWNFARATEELQQDLRPGAAGGRHFAAPRAGRDRRFWGGGLRGPCCAHHTLQRAALPGGLRVEGQSFRTLSDSTPPPPPPPPIC